MLLAAGCGFGSGSDPKPPASRPATGTGPYPTPPHASPAAPLPSTTNTATPKGGVPTPGSVDQRDATAVSRAALTVMLTSDTTTDITPHDANLRAVRAGWCTEDFARQIRDTPPRSAPGATWTTWTRHRAYTTVNLRPAQDAGRPGDDATHALRQWSVTTTARGRDGWNGPPDIVAAFVELSRPADGDPWRVAGVSLQ
ncbi:hypothetical protein I5Q34_07500 [Streptomyces sp. AV19]|uniref:hypothetical protein n=1 Tax=Streptomyces sp. AV19 TaxID=2793068 RepID=UPI0018FEA75A|nr:hypothetical protein [Streptomyces sp. AV19]MBH1934141.1 hypothetical protein [Streptomyces sp. AV19]